MPRREKKNQAIRISKFSNEYNHQSGVQQTKFLTNTGVFCEKIGKQDKEELLYIRMTAQKDYLKANIFI